MSQQHVIRAWKDERYRLSLSEAERAALPAHPAGLIELADADLDAVAGGMEKPKPTGLSPCTMPNICNGTSFIYRCG